MAWFLDPDIEFPNPGKATNAEPLLINTAGSLQYRPEAQVELREFLPGLGLRAHVHGYRLHGGGERSGAAGRKLPAGGSGSTASPAQLWPLEEPAFLKPFQEIDRIRFRLRLPLSLPAS